MEKKLQEQRLLFFFFLIPGLKWTSVNLYIARGGNLGELTEDLRNPCRTQACPESSKHKYILEECNGRLGNWHTMSIQSMVLDICRNIIHHCLRFFRKCITDDNDTMLLLLFCFSISSLKYSFRCYCLVDWKVSICV